MDSGTASFDGSIAVYGHLRAGVGLGTAARGTVAALEAAGVDCRGHDLDDLGRAAGGDDGRRPAISLIHTNPDQVMRLLSAPNASAFASAFEDRYTIGFWAWESLDGLPPHGRSAEPLFDEIWVPSRFTAHGLSVRLPCPVIDMPHPVQVATPAEGRAELGRAELGRAELGRAELGRAELGLPEHAFLFLVVFDELSNLTRKNPVGAVLAFRRAFPEADGRVALVVRARSLSAAGRQALHAAADGHPGITFRVGEETAGRAAGMLAVCDALVSLHRAEGFGLVIAEAMALGRPVLATGYSGNMDFTTAENSLLVRHRLVGLDRADGYYPAGTTWAEPDLDDAARQMRRLAADPGLARRLGTQAAADIAVRLSPAAIGRRMRQRLDTIQWSGRQPRRRTVRYG